METPLKDRRSILIVDDEDGIRYGLEKLFKREGFRVFSTGNFEEAVTFVKENIIDIALLDIRLKGQRDGIDLLKELKFAEPEIVILIITGHGSIDSSVEAMKEGASDYILKPIDNDKLIVTVRKNLEIKSLRTENTYLKKALLNSIFTYDFITDNSVVKEVLIVADKIKNTPATVLITGESGTGKEVLARYIHFTSNRKDGNFVGINCAALSDTLLLSELFGHEKGSFTGAVEQKIGKFELADSGTLFLDEVGDMSLDVQSKLLRVLEERSFERVGGVKKVQVDVRLIAATNRDMQELITVGRFRQDLYYRLNVISCHLPPLRERPEDIPLLMNYFLKLYNQRYNKNVQSVNTGLFTRLTKYSWPGNVRELQNNINQAVLLCDGEEIVSFNLQDGIISERRESMKMIGHGKPLKAVIEEIVNYHEKKLIAKVLSDNKQNRTRTAQDLEITRKTLARKIDKYNL
ncbi:MAG: sigma-54-dependent Fis family transcriptional regulator [Spirochaetales bacterium]|nr:sigma-54-dependent Fis family transcriptional regulator [Spirochaetales bacterium]